MLFADKLVEVVLDYYHFGLQLLLDQGIYDGVLAIGIDALYFLKDL